MWRRTQHDESAIDRRERQTAMQEAALAAQLQQVSAVVIEVRDLANRVKTLSDNILEMRGTQ